MKSKKIAAILVAAAIGISMAGCGGNDSQNAADKTAEVKTEEAAPAAEEKAAETEEAPAADEETGAEESTDSGEEAAAEQNTAEESTDEATLPPYDNSSLDALGRAVDKYAIDVLGANYDAYDVCIPNNTIIAVDDEDQSDVKVYTSMWVFWYSLEGDTLMTQCGGNHPGCLHFKQVDTENYEPTGFDAVADGSDFDESAKEIFGDYYEDFISVLSDDTTREEKRKELISEYVHSNDLSITAYQDFGWDPVAI